MGKLLLVIPFHRGDRGQVERLGKWMTALSKGKRIGPKLLFCATQNAEIKGIGNNFKGLFDEMNALKLQSEPILEYKEASWPKSPNFQFLKVAQEICNPGPENEEFMEDVDAFYYFEPDNLPLRADWFDLIEADYRKQARPFYGVAASYVQRADGSAWEDGKHMIGTGIYPRNAWQRVKGFSKILQDNPSRPWDAITRDEINPNCYFTELIQNCHSSRGYQESGRMGLDPAFGSGHEAQSGRVLSAIYRPNLEPKLLRRTIIINDKVAVFHGCKDSSLRLIIQKDLGIEQAEPLTFAHAGDLGDIIYALPAIKAYGGGIVRLSAEWHAREALTPERIAVIEPLLREQSYIKDVQLHDETYADFDFRHFRHIHQQHSNLAQDQAEWVGANIDTAKPWLTVKAPQKSNHIIVNRTERYHNDIFPWHTIHRTVSSQLRFIGIEKEHEAFQDELGTISYQPTDDLLAVAEMIAGCKMFIGNQSVCFAIAEGMKVARVQETCVEAQDCLFETHKDYKSGTYCIDGNFQIDPVEPVKSIETSPMKVGPKFDIDSLLKSPKFKKALSDEVTRQLDQLIK